MIRVIFPAHLRTLAKIEGEVAFELSPPVTSHLLLDAIESRFPMLRGTIRDHHTFKRRPFLRFFACGEDISYEPSDALLPEAVITGQEPFLIVGSVAGG
jgi:molybdopterin synthase sulfur carrier subunit